MVMGMAMIVVLLLQIAFFANLLLLPFAIYDLGLLMGLLWTLLERNFESCRTPAQERLHWPKTTWQ